MPNFENVHLFVLARKKSGENNTPEYKNVCRLVKSVKYKLDREYVLSLPKTDPCIVVDDLPNIEQEKFVEYLAAAVSGDPSNAYTYAGCRFEEVVRGRLFPYQKITAYDRNPFTPRYRLNDEGNTTIDVLKDTTLACTANMLSKVLHVLPSGRFSAIDTSLALAKLGIRAVCIDPVYDWSGLPRMSRSNVMSVKMDRDETMPLFVFHGWHEYTPVEPLGDVHDKVAVIVTTHDRTSTAKLTLESLVARLKYDNLKWIIADDRSSRGHVRALVEHMVSLGVKDVVATETDENHWGLGASLNNALEAAFRSCNVVLTTEDDWYLQKELDLAPLVKIVNENENIATIRLGAMFKSLDHLVDSSVPGYYKVTNGSRFSEDKTRMLLNLQVAVRHRRLYDTLGYYAENKKPDEVESGMNEKFCSYTQEGLSDSLVVLWPKDFERETLDSRTNPFVHFGESTCGHDYPTPDWLLGKERLDDVVNPAIPPLNRAVIHVAMVSDYNGREQLRKVISSIRKTNDDSVVYVHVVAYDGTLADYAKDNIPATGNGVNVLVKTLSQTDRDMIDACATPQNGKTYSVPPVGLVKFVLGRYVDVPKALYLDTDTLVMKPLGELYGTDLEGNIVGAVVDPGCLFLDRSKYPMIGGNTKYFNSGVMLLDLEQIRNGGFERNMFYRKQHQPCLQFQDQDVFNTTFYGYTKLLPPKYNVLLGAILKVCDLKDVNTLYDTSYKTAEDMVDDAVIWHWASGDKPWMSDSAPKAAVWRAM